mgnify:CR=1 FL=1
MKWHVNCLRRYGEKAEKADFLLFNLGWDKYWGTDAYFGDYPCVDDEVLDYILDELQPDVIVPGHGEVYDRTRAESQREYFQSLIAQVEQNYTPGMKGEQLIAKIDVSKYIDHRPRLGWIMAVNGMAGELRKKSK